MNRLFIANRGEIALRILRACRDLGVETVAAYTRADSNLHHLVLATDKVCVGQHSYLDGDQLIAAALAWQCDALHPGYGFLSENADFAAKVVDAGLNFVGPDAAHIAMMADKARARSAMRTAGVPVLPGSDGPLADVEAAVAGAGETGYPVVLKASHGGGGRGISVARDEASLREGWVAVQAQADALFHDSAVYLERYIQQARHIEVQVVGDGNGNVIHLGARECSIQRHHQKLLEEAPPAGIDAGALERLARVSCDALGEISYRNAGTMEFLYEKGEFYFIEMNTRIQVEHPVTEAITGVDLVQLQLRVAAGEPLPPQESIDSTGHAIECRINAEDENFIPSPGCISRLRMPGGPGIRFDTHVYQGYVVPHHYDSLLGKLIVHGSDRDEAIARMQGALMETEIAGVATNLGLHRQVLRDARFLQGDYDTNMIERLSS